MTNASSPPGPAKTGAGVATMSLLGTPLALVSYQSLLELLPALAERPGCSAVDFCNTQIVTLRRVDPDFQETTNSFDYFVPDGMPLIWCLRAMGASLHDRVYGPTFMRYALSHEKSLRHYFLGGSQSTLDGLVRQAQVLGGGQLRIAGFTDGYYDSAQHPAILEEINRLAPDVIWIGLGTPKQQRWIHDNKALIRRGVLLAVGFAFDVNAGTKRDAPPWMQRLGLTWIFRISQEPKRLLSRYVKYNTLFVLLILLDLFRHLFGRGPKSSGPRS